MKTGIIVTNKGRKEKVIFKAEARVSFEFRLDGVTWTYHPEGEFTLMGGGHAEPMPDEVAGGRYGAGFGVWYSS